MKPLGWNQLRSWNGDQNKAFEELCCQLARHENVDLPEGSEFQRRGTPDGGVESLWILPDGREWGWQAKYFTNSPGPTQWGEMDESVRTAIDKNPRLCRYTICLPTLLPDAPIKNRRSARQHWDTHVKKWSGWASQIGRVVKFLLWDESELIERLSKPEHIGRAAFWFGGTSFDIGWFSRVGVKPAIRQANKRYTQPLHIETSLSHTIEAVQNGNQFKARCLIEGDAFRASLECDPASLWNRPESEEMTKLRESSHILALRLSKWPPASEADILGLIPVLSALRLAVEKVEASYWRNGTDLEREDDFKIDKLWNLRRKVESLDRFLKSPEVSAGLSGRLVITGEAGSGKTHLLCKSAEICIEQKKPAILLLGEMFPGINNPWHEIQDLLGIHCPREEFLGSLDAAAEAYGCRVSIMIDAINEGPGLKYWRRYIGAMLAQCRDFPFVALVFSVRDLYAGELKQLIGDDAPWVEHHGFRGRVAEAARHYFRYYGLAEPNVPALDPEFENPLFLKLLCEALQKRGDIKLSDPPSFGSLLDMVLDDANDRLAIILDYDPAERYVHRAVSILSEMMVQSQVDRLSWFSVIENLRELKPSASRAQCLAHHLLSEEILIKSPLPGSNDGYEVVRFLYQKFSDYLVVKASLQHELADGGSGARTITQDLESLGWSPTARNWLGAAAVLSPELGGVELPDVVSKFHNDPDVREAFLNSIVWRKRTAVTLKTESHVRTLLSGDNEICRETYETLLSVVARPDHRLNADWLDGHLRSMSMAERDAQWSVAVFGGWDREGNVHRLIEWAWQEDVSIGLPDEVVRLATIALVWMFTTPDRFVRDRATKAAVSLLETRIPLLCAILDHFDGVMEAYLQERLYAVACGCALRALDVQDLTALGEKVYNEVFLKGSPPASVLLRDHARTIVDAALAYGKSFDCDRGLLKPPYRSEPPEDPPTEDELRVAFRYHKHDDESRSLSRIYHSVTGDDFNHYVIKDVMQWSNTRGGTEMRKSPRKLFDVLKSRVQIGTRRILEDLDQRYRYLDGNYLQGEDRKFREREIVAIEGRLPSLLGNARARLFVKRIKPFLLDRHNEKFRDYFNLETFERLILKRVLDLGWKTELHGAFDASVPHGGRDSHKVERIGKKYQWIAYDELHARISDNNGLADDNYGRLEADDWRRGLWTAEYRDLDPSLLVRSTPADGWGVNMKNWWTPYQYNGWYSRSSPSEWIRSTDDLPSLTGFIKMINAKGVAWILLDGSHFWRHKVENLKTFEPERDSQELHLIYRSYLTRASDLPKMIAWGRKQNWINDRLPSAAYDYRAHLFEHYSSPRFESPLDDEWIDELWPSNDLPCPFLKTSAEYFCEHSTYDCSIDSTIQISIPSRWLAEKLSIRPSGRYGDFVESSGTVVTFDPSTRELGRSVLLVREDRLLQLLSRERVAIVWTLLGEKNYYPPSYSIRPFGRSTLLGLYSMTDGIVAGDFRTEFES